MPVAFCTYLADSRVPFIFLNSVGTSSDVTTLVHEAGHSFQAWESRNIELEALRWPGLEAAEVHSMGMEHLALPHLHHFFSPEDLARYQRGHIRQGFMRLAWMAQVDHFQHEVYEQNLDAAGRGQCWQRLEERYQPGLDMDAVPYWKANRWHRQGHIFRRPFYYIDYAIAQLAAWQLWLDSLEAPEQTMERNLALCRMGGTKPLKAFMEAGGLNQPFDGEAVGRLVERVVAAVDPC